jgi:hypothetical protein
MESSNGSPAPASQARALALKKKARVLACKGGCLLRTLILYPRVKHSPAWPLYLCPLCQEPFKLCHLRRFAHPNSEL